MSSRFDMLQKLAEVKHIPKAYQRKADPEASFHRKDIDWADSADETPVVDIPQWAGKLRLVPVVPAEKQSGPKLTFQDVRRIRDVLNRTGQKWKMKLVSNPMESGTWLPRKDKPGVLTIPGMGRGSRAIAMHELAHAVDPGLRSLTLDKKKRRRAFAHNEPPAMLAGGAVNKGRYRDSRLTNLAPRLTGGDADAYRIWSWIRNLRGKHGDPYNSHHYKTWFDEQMRK